MNVEPQTVVFLAEILGVVMRHDPVTMAKAAAIWDRRVEPRQRIELVRGERRV